MTKPIKCVYEGNPIVLMGDPMTNGDLTQEYLYGEKYGMGIVLAGGNAGIGRYRDCLRNTDRAGPYIGAPHYV